MEVLSKLLLINDNIKIDDKNNENYVVEHFKYLEN